MNRSENVGIKPTDKNLTLCQSMSHEESFDNTMKGVVTLVAKGFDHDGVFHNGTVLYKDNLILNSAREIMRDVMAGDNGIAKVIFGDLNLDDDSSTSELVNVPAPLEGDIKLVRKVGEKLITSANLSKIGTGSAEGATGRPGIKYEVTLEKTDLVPEGKDKQFILEMALSTVDEKLFSRITHPVIIKTNSLQITLIWELLF